MKKSLKVIGSKIVTRCSELPRLFSCRNSITNPDRLTPVRVENGAEHLGTDIHAAIQHCVETGEVDLRMIDAKYNEQDRERAKELFINGLRVVEEAKRDMKNPQFEVEVSFESEKFVVPGHVDVLDLQGDCAFVVDFKTGRTRDDHYHQMVGYAVGAWTKVGRPERFTVHIAYVYLESGEVTSFSLTTADLRKWLHELDTLPEQYAVNRRCIYCPFNNTCPCFRDYLAGSLSLLLEVSKLPTVNIRKLSLAQRAKLATSMKMVDTAHKRIREFIKDDCIKHGEIETGDGNKFVIRHREYKTLLTSRTLPVIAKYVSAKDIANATRLSLPDLVTAAARRVKGPMRKLIREEMVAKLKQAGAIVATDTPYLETSVEKKCLTKKKSSPVTKGPRRK